MIPRRGASLAFVALVALAAGHLSAHPGLHHDIARLDGAIENDPARADLYLERAYLERLAGQFERALEDLDRAQDLAPCDLRVAAERGMTLAAQGSHVEAEAELTRFLERGPATAPTLAQRARIRARAGRAREAIADYSGAISLSPDVELYMARGAIEERLLRLDDAARGYREGLAGLGGAVVVRLALVRVEVLRRNFAAATALLDEEIARAPVAAEWYLRRAEVLEAAGSVALARADRELALREADRAVRRNPTGVHLLSRAKAEVALGLADEARVDLEHALRKSPRFAEARELLARLDAARETRGSAR